VSQNSDGCAEPAICQTMSGGCPLFQAVVSDMIRSFSSGRLTSAEMVVKRCLEESLAAVCDLFSKAETHSLYEAEHLR
jgi:hypothetical protein